MPLKKRGVVPKVIDDALIKQIAAIALTGANRKDISQQLGVSDHYVRRVFKDDRFKNEIKSISEDVVETAKQSLRVRMSELSNDVMKAITIQLRRKYSMDAVRVAMKILGFGEEEVQRGDTNIQLIMPGSKPAKEVINAEHTVQDSDD